MSFAIVLMVYVLATIVGIKVYQSLNYDWWLSLLIADVAATLLVFVFSVLLGNASVYDPYWSVQPPVIVAAFALTHQSDLFAWLLLLTVGFWAIRLTANWAYTFANLNHQDWRYSMLKEKTGFFYPFINLLGIHLVPTLVVYACILPAVYAVMNHLQANIGAILCLLLSLLAALMQAIADYQMHRYRRHRRTTFIREGLWKYSRHPNYLGEILMWWGVALAVVCVDAHALILCGGALANTLLFLCVSIPMADKRQSAKEGYALYHLQTRKLFPFRKR